MTFLLIAQKAGLEFTQKVVMEKVLGCSYLSHLSYRKRQRLIHLGLYARINPQSHLIYESLPSVIQYLTDPPPNLHTHVGCSCCKCTHKTYLMTQSWAIYLCRLAAVV